MSEVHHDRTGVGHEDELVRRVHGAHPVGGFSGEGGAEDRVGQADIGVRAVEIRQAHDQARQRAFTVRVQDQVLLLLAVCALARLRLARVCFGNP